MPRKSHKTQIVAFKVEEDLAEFLNSLPNKSEFIRKAITAQFAMTCPLCVGSGVVARGLHKHFKPLIAKHSTKRCERCGDLQSLPLSLEGLSAKERERIEQFFHGGPFYCEKCYAEVPPCDDCGWHIPVEDAANHVRELHINGY